jgi:hypothetical protein
MCVAAALATLHGAARAEPADDTLGPGYWRLAMSPFSVHFNKSAEHQTVWAIGVERQRKDHWLAGASYFSNSFGQSSGYVYVGKRFPALLGQEEFFAQLSGGLLYGYVGQYEDKVPLNNNGFSPGALISMGWQFNKNTSATLHLLGDAGLMIQLAWDFR